MVFLKLSKVITDLFSSSADNSSSQLSPTVNLLLFPFRLDCLPRILFFAADWILLSDSWYLGMRQAGYPSLNLQSGSSRKEQDSCGRGAYNQYGKKHEIHTDKVALHLFTAVLLFGLEESFLPPSSSSSWDVKGCIAIVIRSKRYMWRNRSMMLWTYCGDTPIKCRHQNVAEYTDRWPQHWPRLSSLWPNGRTLEAMKPRNTASL